MHAVVGRDFELLAITEFLGGSGPRALVLSGRPGIGKTTLWSAALEAAGERGMRVLWARPSGAEADLSFTALIDLCDTVDLAGLDGVPPPQRTALEVALLRADPTGSAPEPRAIALGLLNTLRALAADGPLLIAIDDIQWLDAASSDVLSFAARRLELRLTRQVLRRVVESAVGNPLFALELGRTLQESGPPAAGEDIPVPDALEDMLGTRVGKLPPEVARLLLAVALGGGLRTGEVTAIGGPEALDAAIDAGVLVVDEPARRSRG